MKFKRSLLNTMLVSTFLTVCASHADENTVTTPLVFANTYITAGESAKVQGDIKAMTYFVAGANTQFGVAESEDVEAVSSSIQIGTAVTTGAGSLVTGNIQAGTAITLGASTTVGTDSMEDGGACAYTALTLGAAATYNADFACGNFSNIEYTSDQLINAKEGYSNLTDINHLNVLPSMITEHTTLAPVGTENPVLGAPDEDLDTYVYNATSLTTGAGIIVTLQGDVNWVFNIDSMLSLGAGSEIKLDKHSTGSVTWNVGGYASLPALSSLVGTVLASGYVSMGAGSTVAPAPSASGDYCGGLFSSESYVSIGAQGTVEGCKEVEDEIQNPVVVLGGIPYEVSLEGLTSLRSFLVPIEGACVIRGRRTYINKCFDYNNILDAIHEYAQDVKKNDKSSAKQWYWKHENIVELYTNSIREILNDCYEYHRPSNCQLSRLKKLTIPVGLRQIK